MNCLKNRLNGAMMSHSCRMMKHRTMTFPFILVPIISSYYSDTLFVHASEPHAEQYSHDQMHAPNFGLPLRLRLHLHRHAHGGILNAWLYRHDKQ